MRTRNDISSEIRDRDIDEVSCILRAADDDRMVRPTRAGFDPDQEVERMVRELRKIVTEDIDGGIFRCEETDYEAEALTVVDILDDISLLDATGGDAYECARLWVEAIGGLHDLYCPSFISWNIELRIDGGLPTADDRELVERWERELGEGVVDVTWNWREASLTWEGMFQSQDGREDPLVGGREILAAVRVAVDRGDWVPFPSGGEREVQRILLFLRDRSTAPAFQVEDASFAPMYEAAAHDSFASPMYEYPARQGDFPTIAQMVDTWLPMDPATVSHVVTAWGNELSDYYDGSESITALNRKIMAIDQAYDDYRRKVYSPANWVHGDDPIDGPTLAEWYADAPLR